MAHTLYPNIVLENKIASMLDTKLSVVPFFTADNTLEGAAGMTKTINVYTATGAVRDVAMGVGNVVGDDVTVAFVGTPYTATFVQGRFPYFDEQEMQDPMVVDVGLEKMAANMTNELTAKFFVELGKATLTSPYPALGLDFNSIVDATALFGEDEDGLYMFINPAQLAQLRKSLKDDLKYVEGFVKTGYIGSVNNIPIYTSKAVAANVAFIASKAAVTVFTKKGAETEQERDANLRKNTVIGRKCHIVALTDATKVVKLVKGA